MSYTRFSLSCLLAVLALVVGFWPMAAKGGPTDPETSQALTASVGSGLATAFGWLDEAAAATVLDEDVPTTADEVFATGEPAVRHCRKRVARDFGPQRGRLLLAVHTDGGGVVSSIDVRENQATDKLVECLTAVITEWRFPATGGDETHERLWVLD